MVNNPVGKAIIIILFFGVVILADRLGLVRPGSRRWQTCLYYIVFFALFFLVLAVLQEGLGILAHITYLLAIELLGALAGLIVGLLESFRRRLPA